jgi:hypothetical protein
MGAPLRHATVQLFEPGSQKAREAGAGDFAQIAYGAYVVKATAPGFEPGEREILVDHDYVWITLALVAWRGHLPPVQPVLAGRVITQFSGVMWAKLVGIFNGVSMESAVSSSGYFHFEPKVVGVYVVILLGEGRVLGMAQVTLDGYKSIDFPVLDSRGNGGTRGQAK